MREGHGALSPTENNTMVPSVASSLGHLEGSDGCLELILHPDPPPLAGPGGEGVELAYGQ